MADPGAARDPEAAARLVEALVKVPVLEDLAGRRMCVLEAMDRLRQRLSVPESDDRRLHVWSMVRAFAGVPEGWRHLARAVQYLAGYDLPSQAAVDLADPQLPPVLEESAQQELAKLLAEVDRVTVPQLPELYRAAAGEHFGTLPDGVLTAWEAYRLLAAINRPAYGAPPSARFLLELATALPAERGDPVRAWVSRQVRQTAVDSLDAQRILEDARSRANEWREPAEHPAYVLIRLHPSTAAPDRVHVTCWANTGSAWEPRRRDDTTVAAADVRRHVAGLLDREEARLRTHRGGVVVEFILPVSMVNEPVEEWSRLGVFGDRKPWPGELGGPPLGQDYTVVVRSLERIEALQLHRVWNERWEVLAAGTGGARAHRCRSEDGTRAPGLYARLKEQPQVVLMALGSPPDEDSGRNELLTGLQAGLPVLIWSHTGPLAEHAHRVAEGALEERWNVLLGQMTRLRIAPGTRDDSAEGSVGSRIAVLWDDPNRLPEIPEPIF